MSQSKEVAFNTGFISTALIAGVNVLKSHQVVDNLTCDLANIFLPILVGFSLWLINRVRHRVEPYTDKQLQDRARCKNAIKELKAEKKDASDAASLKCLNDQLNKQYEKLSKIGLAP